MSATVGAEVAWANGNGGQMFVFRTRGPIGVHRHGWFDREAWMMRPQHRRVLPVDPGYVWGWSERDAHWESCLDAR